MEVNKNRLQSNKNKNRKEFYYINRKEFDPFFIFEAFYDIFQDSKLINFNSYPDIANAMTSETEHEGNVLNPFLNPIQVWQNYLAYCMEVNRNFYENAIRINEQWFKAFWNPWLKAGNVSQRETLKVE